MDLYSKGADMSKNQRTVYVQAPPSQALPALANFFWPGLGHLIQGRTMDGIGWFIAIIAAAISCLIVVGFFLTPVLWIWCIVDAAKYNPYEEYEEEYDEYDD